MISWLSRKKTSVSLSTFVAEYIASCSSCSEVVWIHKLLEGFFDVEINATHIYCDNQSCIKLTENSVFHKVRDMVQRGAVKLQYVPTEEQVADVLTKPLSRIKFEYF